MFAAKYLNKQIYQIKPKQIRVNITKPIPPICTKKFFIRPNIKGPTREYKNYSTDTFCSRKNHTQNEIVNDKKRILSIPIQAKNVTGLNEFENMEKDRGLGYFLKNVYKSTCLGFVGTLGTSISLATISLMSDPGIVVPSFFAGIVGSFTSIYFFSKSEPKYVRKTIELFDEKITTIVPVYERSKYVSSLTLGGSMALMLSPVVAIAGPAITLQAAGISVAVTAGSSLAALFSKPGSLLPYRTFAYGALTGLVGIGLMSVFSAMAFGYNDFFYLMHSIDLYGGLALFTVLNAVDTQNAIKMYRQNQPDHLSCSMTTYLNTINIFVRVLEILAKNKK